MSNDNEFIMYDKSGKVGIPQHKNATTGKYEPSKGDKNAPYSMIVDSNGNPITSTNKFPVDVMFPTTQDVQLTGSKLEEVAVSTTPLASNSAYVTNSIDTTNFSMVKGYIKADQVGYLYHTVSNDGVSFDTAGSIPLSANVVATFTFESFAKYTRLTYVNGETAQTVFKIVVNKCVQ